MPSSDSVISGNSSSIFRWTRAARKAKRFEHALHVRIVALGRLQHQARGDLGILLRELRAQLAHVGQFALVVQQQVIPHSRTSYSPLVSSSTVSNETCSGAGSMISMPSMRKRSVRVGAGDVLQGNDLHIRQARLEELDRALQETHQLGLVFRGVERVMR